MANELEMGEQPIGLKICVDTTAQVTTGIQVVYGDPSKPGPETKGDEHGYMGSPAVCQNMRLAAGETITSIGLSYALDDNTLQGIYITTSASTLEKKFGTVKAATGQRNEIFN